MSDTKTRAPEKVEPQSAPPPAVRPEGLWQPLASFRDEMDRVFDNFWRGFGFGPDRPLRRAGGETQCFWRFATSFGVAAPAIDLVEAEKEYRVTAELPGMEARDVTLSITDETLTIQGEKKEEKEEKTGNYHLSERRFGSFQRAFPLPRGVDRDRIEAKFDKGVLTIVLPKTAETAARQKTIEIKSA